MAITMAADFMMAGVVSDAIMVTASVADVALADTTAVAHAHLVAEAFTAAEVEALEAEATVVSEADTGN